MPYLERGEIAELPSEERALQRVRVYECPSAPLFLLDEMPCGSYWYNAHVASENAAFLEVRGRSNVVLCIEGPKSLVGPWSMSPVALELDEASSAHRHGANALRADGSVYFVSSQLSAAELDRLLLP